MLIHPGNHIGDTWYLVDGDVVHCYYLTCPDHLPRHTAWDIAHATSRDLTSWELHGIAIRRGGDTEWDGRCLATGSVLAVPNGYWMAYTGRWNEPEAAVGLAFSTDLYDWRKVPYNPITSIDRRYYEREGTGTRPLAHWRDPFLFKHEGFVYHYVCARRRNGPIERRATLGVARSADMRQWEVLPPPDVDPVVEELECPQILEFDGRFYLVFSAFGEIATPLFHARYGNSLRAGTYAMVGPTPFGPYSLERGDPMVSPDHPDQPYAGQVIKFKGEHYLLGTVWRDSEPDYVSDPIAIEARDGSLVERRS